jgi:hypothetical protein
LTPPGYKWQEVGKKQGKFFSLPVYVQSGKGQIPFPADAAGIRAASFRAADFGRYPAGTAVPARTGI